jgi:ABC-type transport system involved in cytochrome c biogenesis permease subunit
MSTTLFYIALFLYLAAACFYLVHLMVKRKVVERLGHYALILAFLVHLFSTLFRYLDAGYTPITNFHESLSFFSLAIAGFFFI